MPGLLDAASIEKKYTLESKDLLLKKDFKFSIKPLKPFAVSDPKSVLQMNDKMTFENTDLILDYENLFKTEVLQRDIEHGLHHNEDLHVNEFEKGKYLQEDVQKFPSINEQAARWTLNQKQYQAFIIHCFSFFHHLLKLCQVSSKSKWSAISKKINSIIPNNDPIRHLLYGAPGSGKSKVIHAFINFLKRWKCGHMIVVTTTPGIAAVLLSDCITATTWYKPLGLNVNKHYVPRRTTAREIF